MDLSPVSQKSHASYRTESQSLSQKIDVIHRLIDDYEKHGKDMINVLKDLMKELPNEKNIAEVLKPHELDMIDSIVEFGCDKTVKEGLRSLKTGSWKLRPYQVVDLCGNVNENPKLLRRLVDLSEKESNFEAAKTLVDKSNPRTKRQNQDWEHRHVLNAIKQLSPSKIVYKQREQKPRRPHGARRRSPTVHPIESPHEPSARTDEIHEKRSHVEDLEGYVTISDEELDEIPMFATEYSETLRAKCIESLQCDRWLIEDVFSAVLSPFITHRDDILIVSPGAVIVSSPSANHGKKIREIKPFHELVLIPLHLNEEHWVMAIMKLKERTGVVYDPLHQESNLEQAKLALSGFGMFRDWTYSQHKVRVPSTDWSLLSIDRLTISHTPLKQEDSFNCGILCCVVALCEIVNNETPSKIRPAFWRRAFLELLGIKTDPMHSKNLRERCVSPKLSQQVNHESLLQEDFDELQALVAIIAGHSAMVSEANYTGLQKVDEACRVVDGFSSKFGFRSKCTFPDRNGLRSMVNQRGSRFRKMESRMIEDLNDMQRC